MNARGPHNPFGGAGLAVDKRLGNSFPIVEAVYRQLQQIKYLAENLNELRPKDIELQENRTSMTLEWRYIEKDGTKGPWQMLVPLADITGQSPEMRVSADTKIQWKYTNEPDTAWRDIFDLSGYLDQIGKNTSDIADLADRVADMTSVLQFFPRQAKEDVLDLGVQDHTQYILAACLSGKPLYWPRGKYNVSNTITTLNTQWWFTLGGTYIRYTALAGTAAAPIFDFKGKTTLMGEFEFDHDAEFKNFTNPTIYGGDIIAGSAILIQGDQSLVDGVIVRNSWDNGIAIIDLNGPNHQAVAGSPKYWHVDKVNSFNCGCGDHQAPGVGKVGAGVNVGSGAVGTVSNCNDYGSYVGFILDVGAGASALFSNCNAFWTKVDTRYPLEGSGYGFYIGSSDSQFVNCTSSGSAYRGFWYDFFCENVTFTGCHSNNSQAEGWFLRGGNMTMNGCTAKGASAKGVGFYDAISIDSGAGDLAGIVVIGCHTQGSKHRYGLNAMAGTNRVFGQILGSVFDGQTAQLNLGDKNVGIVYSDPNSGRNFGVNRANPSLALDVFGRARFSAEVSNRSYTQDAFGDSGGNGSVFIEEYSNPNKRIAMGYDIVNEVGVIQAMFAGVAKRALMLNPSGGMLGLGQGNIPAGSNDGYPQIPVISGNPTGNPNLLPGYVALGYDPITKKLWIKQGSGWVSAQFT